MNREPHKVVTDQSFTAQQVQGKQQGFSLIGGPGNIHRMKYGIVHKNAVPGAAPGNILFIQGRIVGQCIRASTTDRTVRACVGNRDWINQQLHLVVDDSRSTVVNAISRESEDNLPVYRC